jgi:hypothetical protein
VAHGAGAPPALPGGALFPSRSGTGRHAPAPPTSQGQFAPFYTRRYQPGILVGQGAERRLFWGETLCCGRSAPPTDQVGVCCLSRPPRVHRFECSSHRDRYDPALYDGDPLGHPNVQAASDLRWKRPSLVIVMIIGSRGSALACAAGQAPAAGRGMSAAPASIYGGATASPRPIPYFSNGTARVRHR